MAEKPDSHSKGSGRKSREYEKGASSVTARREDSSPEEERMMETVVGSVAARSEAPIPEYFVNRRIRIRTYGGVGGREPRGSLLPDVRVFPLAFGRPGRLRPCEARAGSCLVTSQDS